MIEFTASWFLGCVAYWLIKTLFPPDQIFALVRHALVEMYQLTQRKK